MVFTAIACMLHMPDRPLAGGVQWLTKVTTTSSLWAIDILVSVELLSV